MERRGRTTSLPSYAYITSRGVLAMFVRYNYIALSFFRRGNRMAVQFDRDSFKQQSPAAKKFILKFTTDKKNPKPKKRERCKLLRNVT